ncbi:hypothetical protein TREMEDRAFT_66487 [Tremella mesenterica DSM 1558]|uniref:uncharacterized protein n=1 Tax=Tremella mesenterica (strain ATCC 24925 / CBS 8224 / DSM 1558 / NBRC 9311 / NRRL Y-6157 / RJB 2259-6 / UBC 559-6) TaxID=578456 RepID=UPI00032C7BBB|nr:uncharacterized protein TREMEDRAFT_66487 [Tremella mesenterica DSM 1558]EIW65496.1 hypothetical protein TREMEDRAFT_66487 [Tremella mesenterica DSM 1558]
MSTAGISSKQLDEHFMSTDGSAYKLDDHSMSSTKSTFDFRIFQVGGNGRVTEEIVNRGGFGLDDRWKTQGIKSISRLKGRAKDIRDNVDGKKETREMRENVGRKGEMSEIRGKVREEEEMSEVANNIFGSEKGSIMNQDGKRNHPIEKEEVTGERKMDKVRNKLDQVTFQHVNVHRPRGFSHRRHDSLAPEPLDFHETSIEFDPTCDLVVVFPVPLQVEESALRTLGRIGEYCMLTRGKARKMIPEKEELEQGRVPEEEIPTSSSRSTISHDLTSTTTTPDPLNELLQQLSQLLAIMTMQQKEQNALREELATMKADRQNQQLLTSKGASSIKIEENKPYLEPKLTNNERTGRTRCADPPTFSGERGELDNFLAACHMNFEFKGAEYATDRRKILFMYGYLRGTPQMLLTPAITNPTIQGLKEELLKVVVVNNTDPRTKSDWIYFKQHVIGTEENQRMAETMIAANRWAARRKNEMTWLPPRSNSMRLDPSPPNTAERHSQSTGRGPLPGGKPGMMNYGLPNDPPVTWTEDGGRLSENEMTWRRENRCCLKCRSPEHYANNCPNGGNTRNNIRGSPNPHSSPIPSGSNSIPTGSKGPLVRGMAVTFEEEGNEYLA